MIRAITSTGRVSSAFLQEGIADFESALLWVKALPYRRNENKEDMLALFHEGCGTCSSKHALLARLAREMNWQQIVLCLGFYRMNAFNTPQAGPVLATAGLDHLPEAHVYLRVEGRVVDVTLPQGALDFEPQLMEERVIAPENIAADKVRWHRAFIAAWIESQALKLDLEEVWALREACIAAIAASGN